MCFQNPALGTEIVHTYIINTYMVCICMVFECHLVCFYTVLVTGSLLLEDFFGSVMSETGKKTFLTS